MSPGCDAGLTHLSAQNSFGVTPAWSFLNMNSEPPGDFMNTVCELGWVGVKYSTPEMKLLAWLCMAWRPPLSSTLTHISFSNQRRRSPNRCTPNSTSLGVISEAVSVSSGLSLGCSIAVCERLADELLSRVAWAVKCSTKRATRGCPSVPGARMNGVGNMPKTSSIRRSLSSALPGVCINQHASSDRHENE